MGLINGLTTCGQVTRRDRQRVEYARLETFRAKCGVSTVEQTMKRISVSLGLRLVAKLKKGM